MDRPNEESRRGESGGLGYCGNDDEVGDLDRESTTRIPPRHPATGGP